MQDFLHGEESEQNLPSVRCWRLSHGESADPEQNMCKCTDAGRYPFFSGVKFHVECTRNLACGPLGARVMSIFVKTYLFVKVELGDNRVEKSAKNYIEWSSQRTERLDFGSRYDGVMISVEDAIWVF